jgi:D-glycero-alpha-D-manno-heptose-7-phosphate kinase
MGDSTEDRPVASVRVPARVDFAGGWTDVRYFAEREGGLVLNAAIDRYVEGRAEWAANRFHLQYTLDLPSGSHLGTSSAVDVAWLALTYGIIGKRPSAEELAEGAYRLEKLLGIEGGKQDGYAAAFGGVNLLRFGKADEPAIVERLSVPEATLAALEARCVLCYVGLEEAADRVHTLVWQRYREGNADVAAALRDLRDSVVPARNALLAGDLPELARLMSFNRDTVRRLHPSAVTPRMDALFQAGEAAGAIGSKACGGGGGGCLLFLVGDAGPDDLIQALQKQGAEIISFRFDRQGPAF